MGNSQKGPSVEAKVGWKGFSLIILLLFWQEITVSTVSAQAAVSYRVDGQLKVNDIDYNAANQGAFVSSSTAWAYSFSVLVSEDSWRIEATPTLQPPPLDDLDLPPGSKPSRLGWKVVAASDGSEFANVRNGPRSKPDSVYSIQRGPGSAPFGIQREIVALWYAYASHRDMAHAGRDWFVPMERLRIEDFAVTTNRVRGRTVLFEEPPGLPKNVTTFGYIRDLGNGRVGYLDIKVSFTNTVFRVLEKTNVGGLTLPLKSKVEFFNVNPIDGEVRSEPSHELVMETESIIPSATLPQYPPELSGGFLVIDYRYLKMDGTGKSSVITKDAWPTEDQVRSGMR